MSADDEAEAEIDELYGLVLDQFTAARDELAKRLRKDGDRETSQRVKALRKPALVAWALNQVRRSDPALVDQLIAAGQRLREAQEGLLAGGEHRALREAVAEERRLVQEIGRLAERELAQAGHAAGPTLQNKLWQTLQAVARDEPTREQLSAGRLEREAQISDFGLPAAVEHSPAQRPAPKPASRRAAKSQGGGEDAGLERQRQALQRRLQKAQQHQHELADKRKAAERRAREAGRGAERAQAAATRARVAATRDHEAAAQAAAKAREAAQRTAELEEALRQLMPGRR